MRARLLTRGVHYFTSPRADEHVHSGGTTAPSVERLRGIHGGERVVAQRQRELEFARDRRGSVPGSAPVSRAHRLLVGFGQHRTKPHQGGDSIGR